MAQIYSEVGSPAASFASNLAYSNTGTSTILEDVPCLGLRNLAVTVVCSAGSVTAVALYGSPDGVNYIAIPGFSSFTVAANNTGHSETTGIFQYLRLTITGTATVDAYLYAIQ